MLPTNPLLNATAPAGPHLPVALLRQYAAGTLAGASRHRVEAHTLACPRCADILEGLLQTPPATTDQALAQLQQRLRLRLQQAETTRPPLPRLGQRWLVPQLAAAATLLFGLLAGGWYTWQQRHAPPAAEVAATRPAVLAAPSGPAAPAEPPAPGASPAASPVPSRPAAPAGRLARANSQLAARPSAPRAATDERPGQAASGSLPAAATPAPHDSAVVVAQAVPAASRAEAIDSVAPAARESEMTADKARRSQPADAGRTWMSLMPTAPAIPPVPAGGYAAWREKIRHEATEFKPDDGEKPLSGTVQLRLLIGPDGKIQQMKVLHGLRADYDEEAQRLVCDGPAWVPGIGGGKRAAQLIDVSVPF